MDKRPFLLTHTPPVSLEIKYGANKVSAKGKRFPSKLDHFIVVSRERGQMNFLQMDDVMEALGNPEPKSIPIQLLSDAPTENFPLFRGMWSPKDGKLGCGAVYGEETAMRRFRLNNGSFEWTAAYEHPCNAECNFWQEGKCKLSGILYLRLADHLPQSGKLGVLRVKGIYAMKRIAASLDIIAKQTGGILANLPLQVSIHYETKRVSDGQMQKIPLLSIEPSVGASDFMDALEREVLRRQRLNEITGFPMSITGILEHVNNREAISDEEPQADVEVEAPVDPKVAEITKDLNRRKAEIFISQATNSEGDVNVEKLEELVSKDQDRKSDLDINF